MAPTSSDGNWHDLGVRAAAALILMPVVIGCVWLGGTTYELLLLTLAGLMIWEWCKLVFSQKEWLLQGLVFGAGCALSFACVRVGQPGYAAIALLLAWALSSGLATVQGGWSFWRVCGVPYIVLPVLALFLLRTEPLLGLVAIVWLLAVIWTTDTFAYFAGRLFGGPKLSLRYSPKKTWSGLLGGALGAACAAALVSYSADLPSLWASAALGASTAVVSQLGDIFESAGKRHFNVKDSSTLIPGHGGILDRVDGLVFGAVFVACIGYIRFGDLGQVAHFLL